MNRRGFLQRLVGGAAITSVQISQVDTLPETDPDSIFSMAGWPTITNPLIYGTHEIHWTGWKSSQEHNWLAGQWIAWPRKILGSRLFVPYLYVNVPGMIGGPYRPGSVFHLGSRGRIATAETPIDVAFGWIGEGREYIKQLADAYCGDHPDSIGYGLFEFPDENIRPVRI